MSVVKTVAIVPAFDAALTIGPVVTQLVAIWPGGAGDVVVVDDGSRDATAAVAREAGANVVSHRENRGKGAALRTGLEWARARGATTAVSLDADGQHPPGEAVTLATDPAPRGALVLGVRDLAGAGAARANRFGNAVSDFFLSTFARRRFGDTQCGLRRYPVDATLALGARDPGYAFEAEMVLRAARAGWPIVEVPVSVVYPPASSRTSHFHVVRDPARIVRRVVATTLERSPSR